MNTRIFPMLIAGWSLATAPVNAVQVEGNRLVLSPEEMQACATEGGCDVLTLKRMQLELRKAFEAGQQKCGVRA